MSKKVLLTSVCRPIGANHGDAPSVGYELLYRQVTRVNLHQQVPGFHRLIASDGHLLDLAGNFRRDGDDRAIEERIIRGFMRERFRQVAQAEKHQPEQH